MNIALAMDLALAEERQVVFVQKTKAEAEARCAVVAAASRDGVLAHMDFPASTGRSPVFRVERLKIRQHVSCNPAKLDETQRSHGTCESCASDQQG